MTLQYVKKGYTSLGPHASLAKICIKLNHHKIYSRKLRGSRLELSFETFEWNKQRTFCAIKVAEHSFQEPMPNLPLLLSYLCFGACFFARVKVKQRRVYSCILVKVCAVTMATALLKKQCLKNVLVI